MTKQKFPKANIRLINYCQKYCRSQCTLLLQPGPKSLTKLYPQIQDFKRVLDLNFK